MTIDITASRDLSVRVIATERTWMEGDALRQLHATARLPDMQRVVGMPDLHPGNGTPVGAAFLTRDTIYPTLVGPDIGCGMGLWLTDLATRKAKPERMATCLDGLDLPYEGDTTAWLATHGIAPTDHDAGLGTVGRGNHFTELLAVHEVRDGARAAALGIDPSRLSLLVHSGSRGLGEAVLRRHVDAQGHAGVRDGSPEAERYAQDHAHAVRWAEANRALCAHRALKALRTMGIRLLDVCHNCWTRETFDGCGCILHRKGAAPADRGPVVIPGSRGDFSYLVDPVTGTDEALRSLAHGAGRKVARSRARGLLAGRYRREDLAINPWGGRVVCGDELLSWEEAPECYKDAAGVIGDLEEAGLLTVVAVFRPVVTFKTSVEAPRSTATERAGRQRDRRAARQAKAAGR